jgi:hypothetical protein
MQEVSKTDRLNKTELFKGVKHLMKITGRTSLNHEENTSAKKAIFDWANLRSIFTFDDRMTESEFNKCLSTALHRIDRSDQKLDLLYMLDLQYWVLAYQVETQEQILLSANCTEAPQIAIDCRIKSYLKSINDQIDKISKGKNQLSGHRFISLSEQLNSLLQISTKH